MSTIQIKSKISISELLNVIEQLNLSDLDKLTQKALSVRANKVSSNLSEEETKLFEIINQSLPDDIQKRFQYLQSKKEDGTLTELELDEGMIIIEQIEELDNKRMEALIHLSHLRGISLQELKEQLDLFNKE